jgi:hypothetical protein
MKPAADDLKNRFKLAPSKTLGVGNLKDALLEAKKDLIGKTATPLDGQYGAGKIVNIDVNTRTEKYKVCLERGIGVGVWYNWIELEQVSISE